VYVDYSPEERALRTELRSYFARLLDSETQQELARTEGGGPCYQRALAQMGKDGWLGIGWPKEVGGQNRPAIEQFIFFDEVQRAGFPIPFLTLNSVGPTIMKFGTPEQKARFLPPILRGELHFAIGYTEPQAGTDLASLKTRAERVGDEYVVNGQKVFTSCADYADYIWCAVRTDQTAVRHKGISIMIIDRKAPGVSLTPIRTLGGNNTSATYLEDVRVPANLLVGRENEGWKLITNQLNHERVALCPSGPITRFLEEISAWARETGVIERPWVRANLARVAAKADIVKLLNWRQAWSIAKGGLPPEEASAVKVFATEFYVEAHRLLMEVLGEAADLQAGSAGALLAGRLERYARAMLVLTFGGGTNEVQRDIIAMVGLGMPRPPR
jgi:alkylation response protein AidB-like acyl-CoA dehydrogenase